MGVLTSLLAASLEIIGVLLDLYMMVIVVWVILGWLIVFDVVNPRNRFVGSLNAIAQRVTEPFLRPLRRFIPTVSGVDLSPLALILIIMFLQSFLRNLATKI